MIENHNQRESLRESRLQIERLQIYISEWDEYTYIKWRLEQTKVRPAAGRHARRSKKYHLKNYEYEQNDHSIYDH